MFTKRDSILNISTTIAHLKFTSIQLDILKLLPMKDQGCWAIEILMIGNFNINERNFEKYLKVEKFPNQFWPILSWIPFDIYSANIKMETLKENGNMNISPNEKVAAVWKHFYIYYNSDEALKKLSKLNFFVFIRILPGSLMIDLYHI